MKTCGALVQEAIDLMNRGAAEQAALPVALAVEATIGKASGKDSATDGELKAFLKENWPLIAFMGLPRALPLPLSLPFALKRILPSFNVHHGAEEIVLAVLRGTLQSGRLPAPYAFHAHGEFAVRDGKMLLPAGMLTGLLGSVIFHPLNAGEEIGEKYWISISDFKMFVSELWGRRDLAERIRRFYLERD